MKPNRIFITPDQAKGIAIRSRMFTRDRAERLLAKKRSTQKLLALTGKTEFASKKALVKRAQTKVELLQARLEATSLSMTEIMAQYSIPEEHRAFLMKLARKIEEKEFAGKTDESKKAKREMQTAVELILNNPQKGHPFVMHLEWARQTNKDNLKTYFIKPQAKK